MRKIEPPRRRKGASGNRAAPTAGGREGGTAPTPADRAALRADAPLEGTPRHSTIGDRRGSGAAGLPIVAQFPRPPAPLPIPARKGLRKIAPDPAPKPRSRITYIPVDPPADIREARALRALKPHRWEEGRPYPGFSRKSYKHLSFSKYEKE